MKIRNIRSAVRALTNQKKDLLTEEEIYKSRQMRIYLQDMSKSVCGNDCKAPTVFLIADGPKGITACTDGGRVIINYESELVRFFSTPESRFMAVMGFFYHEHAHVLYNDFGVEEQALKRLKKGAFYGKEPVASTPEAQDALVELKDALANPNFSPIFETIYHDLLNTVIDPHDEGKMMDEFGGLAVESIMKVVEALRATSMSLEDVEKEVEKKKFSKLTAMYNIILEYVRFGRILCFDEKLERNSEYMKVLRSVAAHVENARWTDDPKARFTELNSIVLALWPYVQEELKNIQSQSQNQNQQQNLAQNPSQSQQSQQGSQNVSQQSPSPEDIQNMVQQVLQQLNQGASSVPQTQAPKGNTSKKAKANAQKAQAGQQQPAGVAPSSASKASQDALGAAYNQVANDLAQELAENQLEREQEQEIQHGAENQLSQTSAHKGFEVDVKRISSVTDDDVCRYNKEMDEIALYSKKLKKQMLEIMKDLQMGALNRHKAFGRIICPKDAYRPDELMFANKKSPVDLPDMAVSVLVDHSRSMSGERIKMSCKAAILLLDFARGIGIPVAVCGHRSHHREVQYIVYTDFDQYSDRDRYRLAKMSAGGWNRDGAAIEISASRLEKRPEKLKLLIVISDGRPNHVNYGGEEAENDIKSIIARYRRKGVEVIGAAIGDDREIISRIYGDGFLDITDLSTLPKTLTKLVQKRLLSQII